VAGLALVSRTARPRCRQAHRAALCRAPGPRNVISRRTSNGPSLPTRPAALSADCPTPTLAQQDEPLTPRHWNLLCAACQKLRGRSSRLAEELRVAQVSPRLAMRSG
jgi:hypothetical protein